MAELHDNAPATTTRHGDDAREAGRAVPEAQGDSAVGRSVTINRSRAELYAFWRDFSRLPAFMENVVRIDVIDDVTSHWVVKAPGIATVEWNAIITEDVADTLIAWSSVEGADVPNSGRIDFRDAGDRGTIVSATILYDPPAGFIGKVIAKMFQREPAIQARRDLRRFKQLMETGEVATSARTLKQLEEEAA